MSSIKLIFGICLLCKAPKDINNCNSVERGTQRWVECRAKDPVQGSTLAVFRYPEHPRFSDGIPDSPAQ